MNFNEFEDRLKQDIYNDTADVDTEVLWNRIQKKDRKRRPIWLFFLGVLTVGLFGSVYFINGREHAPDSDTISRKAPLLVEEKIESLSLLSKDADEILDEGMLDDEMGKALIGNETSIRTAENKGLILSAGDADNQKLKSSIPTQNRIVNNELNNKKKLNGYNKAQADNVLVNQKLESAAHTISDDNKKTVAEKRPERRLRESRGLASGILEHVPRIGPWLLLEEPVSLLRKIKILDLISADQNVSSVSDHNIWIGISGGTDIINRSITENTMSDQLKWSLTDERLESVINLSAGFEVGLDLSRRLYLRSGLRYNRFIERVAHSWTTSSQITLQDQVVEERQTSMGIVQVVDDIEVTQIKSIQLKEYNSASFLEVPLGLGIRSLSKDRNIWFSAELGTILAFSTAQDGTVFKTDEILISLEEQASLKGNFGMGIYGQITMHKELTNNLSAHLSLRAKTYLNPLSEGDYVYNVRYLLYGSQMGIRYRL